MKKELEEFLVKTGIKIAKSGKGALFVVKEGELKYSNLFPQDIVSFDILKEPRRFELLAIQDGAMIIDSNGNLLSYCANIEEVKTIQGFGTRHVAASTASINNIAISISEEDKKIRIWKKGKIIQEIDPYAKDIENKVQQITEISKIAESVGFGAMSGTGTVLLAPFIGLSPIAGVTVFVATTALTYVITKLRDSKIIN